MSHFCVLVTGNDIEAALAPFQENNMGDCPAQYLAFHDVEDENRTKYENESTERITMPDGGMLLPWDEVFRVPGAFGTGGGSHKAPEHLERRQVPFKETFATFEQFMSDWCGHTQRDPKTGRYGYWENPQKKWDWYSVGGRWGGSLKLKPGAEGTSAPRRWDSPEDAPDNGVDQARAGDVDWLGMIGEAAAKARDQFRRYTEIIAGRPVLTWKEMIAKVDGNADGYASEAARSAFHDQDVMKDLRAAFPDSWGISDVLEAVLAFNGDEQAYADFMGLDRSRMYAILHEGQWHEPGGMGWFGCSTETLESRKAYAKTYWNIVLHLPPETLVTVVDCHI